MRLRTVNRLCLMAVSSAVVTSLLAGCHPHPVNPNKPMPKSNVPASSTGPTDMGNPATLPATMEATTLPANLPVPPTTALVTPAPVIPAPVTQPVTEPVTPPTTMTAASKPATQAATMPMTPSTQAATMPAFPPIANAPRPTDPKIIETDAILAEQIAGIAELEFATKVPDPNAWPWIWKHQIALLTASGELNPQQPRFPRLEALAWAQLHDENGEINALGKAIVSQQATGIVDSFTWIRDLDLRVKAIQTADKKLAYLDQIIGTDAIPADVRSHAGFLKVHALIDRGQDEAATKALGESLVLCPTSMECLKLRYNLLPPTATRFERCGQLLDLLRANPLQSRCSAQLGDLVADGGMVRESLPFLKLAVTTQLAEGSPVSHSLLNLVAANYVADEKPDALRYNLLLLKIDPTNTQARLMQLVITRSMGDKEGYAKAMQEASNTLNNRVVDAVNAALPAALKATTRPIEDPTPMITPDLGPAVAQLVQNGSPEVKQQFEEAVADLAMLQGYFAQKPDEAGKLVDALEKLVPANTPELARLRGWNLLLSNKLEDANKAFTMVATEDPLAQLGMVEIMLAGTDPAKKEQAESIGRRLILDHPSGLLGAILWEKLHNDRVKLIPGANAQVVALQAALADFPQELLSVIDDPRQIYGIHVEPTPVPSYIGEPLMGTVIISNLSNEPITIGPEGLIRPELLFKMSLDIPNAPAFSELETYSGPTVLQPKNQNKQLVRLDQTQLLNALGQLSNNFFEISTYLTTNEVVRRVGGYEVSSLKKFYRQASPPSPANIQTQLANITTGRADQKIIALSLMQIFVAELHQDKNPNADVLKQMAAMLEAIHHARIDPLPAVSAWAMKCEAELDGQHRESIIRDLTESEDWRHRQVGLLMVGSVPPAVRDEILNRMEKVETQESVKLEITATRGIAALPPATMPAHTP